MSASAVMRGLFALAWVGLAVALVAALSTPTQYCDEGAGEPTETTVMIVGLIFAAICGVGALLAASRKDGLRGNFMAFVWAILLLGAVLAVLGVYSHQSAAWGCA